MTQQRCPTCGGKPIVNKTQYGMRSSCCGLVGWDGRPLVDSRTRTRRQKFHEVFDPLWKGGRMSRAEAYHELAKIMKLPEDEVHGSVMGYSRLGRAIKAAKKIKPKRKKGRPEKLYIKGKVRPQ